MGGREGNESAIEGVGGIDRGIGCEGDIDGGVG